MSDERAWVRRFTAPELDFPVWSSADPDLLALVTKAKTYLKSSPGHVYMTGGSQGGLITTLAVERYPGVFTGGGLAACGPIGSYRRQLRYVADFRAVSSRCVGRRQAGRGRSRSATTDSLPLAHRLSGEGASTIFMGRNL